ncbi:MAG: hypothetical protein Q8O82_12005 [Pseudorhodobacter sp.]|nr:hypothetical protein [Pseudorhodobacter sp.]
MTHHPGSVDNMKQTATEVTLGDDLLRGADEIARYMFGDVKHRRKVYYLTGEAAKGLPHFKIGSLICARKSTLMNWIAEQEGRV